MSRIDDTLLYETDWLASTPIFYSCSNGSASDSIQGMVSTGNVLRFHAEGMYNYLDFGYSVFGQSPLEKIKFLSHSSRLWQRPDGALKIEILNDPFEDWVDYKLSESDIIDLIRHRVQIWESSLPADQEIILPLSGGFDSRLLLWCLSDRTRVRAYTYGTSGDQSNSIEVVHARALAEKFGVRWERIQLGKFHDYFDAWDSLFGPATHAHGMYHFEFYAQLRKRLHGRHAFLSGILGDVWAGSIPPLTLSASSDLVLLGHTHGMRADPSRMQVDSAHEIREQYWSDNKDRLTDDRFQIVTTARHKLMLLSYLMRVPREFGLEPWTPFLDIDIVMSMINLPKKRRKNREWQRDFFQKVGLDLESQGLKSSRNNNLNYQALRNRPIPPLKKELFAGMMDPDYIDWINKNISINALASLHHQVSSLPVLGRALRRFGLASPILQAYFAYLCLRPIQLVFLKNKGRAEIDR